MGRGRWGLVVGAMLACSVVAAWGVAVFPDALYVYREPSDVIRKSDFSPVAQEVEAIERTLGAHLNRIPTVHAGCSWIQLPQPGESFQSIFRAPKAGVLRSVTCETGGVNSQVFLDVRIDDGTPATALSLVCGNGMSNPAVPSAGSMAVGDRLDYEIGQVIGAADWVSICPEFEPGT